MQRVAWTDERLDDLSHRMESGFERVDRDIRDLRAEMNHGFASVRAELTELRGLIWRLNGGIIVAVVVAILLRGL